MTLVRIASTRRRRRLSRSIPSNGVRRANSARAPRAAALAMLRDIRRRLEAFNEVIERLLFPVLVDFAPQQQRSLVVSDRADAPLPERVLARLTAIQLRLVDIFDERELDDMLDVIGKRVDKKNGRELQRLVGIAIASADPGVSAFVDNWRAINVSRIKSLAGEQLVQITRLLEASEAHGSRVEVLRDAIQERFKVTRSRAALLARDQTITLNAQISRARQQNLGIESYVWTTSGDNRVRDAHADRDGEVFRWDTPPEDGHPGEPIQCRCQAYPVLPELA